MPETTRRSFLKHSLLGAATGLTAFGFQSLTEREAMGQRQNGFKPAEREAMEDTAEAFRMKYDVPALSVAIATQGRLVYMHGFGVTDKDTGEKVTPDNLFRIASVTKPITSTTIFHLIEKGKLRLADRVFGPKAVLGTDYGEPPYKQYIEDITIEHLLTHTAGGWQNDGNDPMFHHPQMDHKELITWTIANQPLQHRPGTNYAYSNFGYCILGRVIEKLTGKPYHEAVQQEVLKPCGITGMRISGNTLEERAPKEVIYYDQNGGNPYGMNVKRMDSHGGWLATPTDLVRFLVRVDGFKTKPDILDLDTIVTMTTASAVQAGYAKGWSVNKYHNWWHNGSMPGTTTIMVRTSGQFCWAALTNTRKVNSGLDGDLDQLMWNMVGKVTTWPSYDLFG
ncbi:MAG TPA: serine hydrolase domain-containing protein [Chthonomonadaceae bacterium]|nr:serine hydrolase domain-containing protein [Chthonomonadaceae bacterium]